MENMFANQLLVLCFVDRQQSYGGLILSVGQAKAVYCAIPEAIFACEKLGDGSSVSN